MADSGRGIRGHGIRYLAATSDLAGAADPRQIDAQAPAIAAIHAPGSVCSCSGSAVARARLARRGRLSQAVRGGGLRAHGERHRADSAHQRRWLGELLRRADRERAASGSTWSTRWSTFARWARRSSVWSEPPERRSHGRIDRPRWPGAAARWAASWWAPARRFPAAVLSAPGGHAAGDGGGLGVRAGV
jgi:hypothetical protein